MMLENEMTKTKGDLRTTAVLGDIIFAPGLPRVDDREVRGGVFILMAMAELFVVRLVLERVAVLLTGTVVAGGVVVVGLSSSTSSSGGSSAKSSDVSENFAAAFLAAW